MENTQKEDDIKMLIEQYNTICDCIKESTEFKIKAEMLGKKDIVKDYEEILDVLIPNRAKCEKMIQLYVNFSLILLDIDIMKNSLVKLPTNMNAITIYLILTVYPDIKISVCYWNNEIEDVTPLRKVTQLVLGECNNITDVSSLKDVPNLCIINCKNITDISMLKNPGFRAINLWE